MNIQNQLKIATFLGFLSVVLGAFASHALKDILDTEKLNSFETGVRYQFYHVVVILVVGLTSKLNEKTKKRINNLFLLGIVLFSGSIFLLSTAVIPAKYIWFVTPIGGLFFMLGWLVLLRAFFKKEVK